MNRKPIKLRRQCRTTYDLAGYKSREGERNTALTVTVTLTKGTRLAFLFAGDGAAPSNHEVCLFPGDLLALAALCREVHKAVTR